MSERERRSFTSGARLYRQVSKIVGNLQGNDPVFKGVADSVGAEVDSVAHFKAILALRKLFERAISDISESNLDASLKTRHTNDIQNVKSAFTFSGLAQNWAHAQKNALQSEKIERLAYVDSALQGSLGANVILADELEDLVTAFRDVIVELEKADLPEATILTMKDRIERLIFDLEHADLFGAEGAVEDVEQIYGRVIMANDQIKNSAALKEALGKALGAVMDWINKIASVSRSAEYLLDKADGARRMLESL